MKKQAFAFLILLSLLFSELFANKTFVGDIDSLLSRSSKMLPAQVDSAIRLSFRAAELSILSGSPEHLARSYASIAKAYESIDDRDNQIYYYKKAGEAVAALQNDRLKLDYLLLLAQAYFHKGNYDESFLLYKKAKPEGERAKDKNIMYEIYCGLGNNYIFEEKRNVDSASYYFDKALVIALEQKDTFKLAESYRHLNDVFGARGKWDEAKFNLDKAIELYTHLGNWEGIAHSYKDMGDVYYYTKEKYKAIEYYLKAYEIEKKTNNTNGIAVGACDLAYMYAIDNRKDLLDRYGDESYELAVKTKSWETIRYSTMWLGRAYERVGDHKKALFYVRRLGAINDSIINRKRIEKNQREEVQSGFEQKIKDIKAEEEKQKAIAEEKEHNQKVVRNILIAGFLIALVLLFIAYRSYVAKKKANVIISRQKGEVEQQKQKIEEINKEMTDSINYAKIIQRSILPEGKEIMKTFPESFGLYKPKSVVSGDFYWFHKKGQTALIAAVDCTGHGVPGALMSMIGVEKLNEAVAAGLTRPADILMDLNRGVKTTLRQNDNASVSKDGMDIALCCFDLQKNTLRFSGAQRPLWLIRNGILNEYKSSKVSIGGTTPDSQEFISHEIGLQKGDCIYIFSDGFADQFGGGKGKKIMTKNFKEALLSIQNIPFLEQEAVLDKKLMEWQGDYEQVDDILVIGIRVPHP